MKVNAKTLGILGGGQLGRMSAVAAAQLGIKTHIYCPDEDSPASHVAAKTFIGSYTDKRKLKAFAQSVDVITYEFENIPVETVRFLEGHKPVHPDDQVLEIAQHRGTEKKFLNDIGIETPKWVVCTSAKELQQAIKDMERSECILKTTRFGYDGKGQTRCHIDDDTVAKWEELNADEIIAEERLDFACEISVIVARDKLGQTALYGPILNEHISGILSRSTVPAEIPDQMAKQARDKAILLADAVNLVGVLAIELFVTRDGRILANEMAPRPHNSGHYSIDACSVSQFEQHVRTVCGMPVGLPGRHSDAVMANLIGKDVKKLGPWLELKGACLHLYGKDEIKHGRKMGHVTVLKPADREKKSAQITDMIE